MHDRFSVFAEAGFGYTWSTLSPAGVGVTGVVPTRTRTFAMRSGIGAIVYF